MKFISVVIPHIRSTHRSSGVAGILALLAVNFLTACSTGEKHVEETHEESKKPFAVETAAVKAGRQNLQIEIPGIVRAIPDQLVKVTPALSGKIAELSCNVGQRVSKGQVLAKLDDRNIRDQLEQNKASQESAMSANKNAQDNLRFANDNLLRQNKLYEAEVGTKKDVILAESAKTNAENQLTSAQSQIHAVQASRLLIETERKRTILEAPIGGLVVARNLNVGDSCDTNTVVAQIVDLSSIFIECQIPVPLSQSVKPGQSVQIYVPPNPEPTLFAAVQYLSPTIDTASNTVKVTLKAKNSLNLRENQTVTALFSRQATEPLIAVPTQALVPDSNDPAKRMVYRVSNNRARRVPVDVLEDKDNTALVSGDLHPGDIVIAHDGYGLPDDAEVVPRTGP